ncbi:hypothetical protein [Thalassomonas haliotis]|uniref:PH domain-containing protein n=1 Tax=Thalassomonas haliotis TaxID=485448 RepID=A0ABY7V8P3_9GAMM|nr:hypothetical protein [Thalassomonas haliotis]WDE09943.1 hypothetical protein H3N35_16715 [Thalassomonas haliotis]
MAKVVYMCFLSTKQLQIKNTAKNADLASWLNAIQANRKIIPFFVIFVLTVSRALFNIRPRWSAPTIKTIPQ